MQAIQTSSICYNLALKFQLRDTRKGRVALRCNNGPFIFRKSVLVVLTVSLEMRHFLPQTTLEMTKQQK